MTVIRGIECRYDASCGEMNRGKFDVVVTKPVLPKSAIVREIKDSTNKA